jgi:hypothetical protein
MLFQCCLIDNIKSKLGLSVSTAFLSELFLQLAIALVLLFALLLLDVFLEAAEVNVLGTTLALPLNLLEVFSLDLLFH